MSEDKGEVKGLGFMAIVRVGVIGRVKCKESIWLWLV